MRTKTRFKKLCAIALSLCMVVSIFSNIVVPASAAGEEYWVTSINADSQDVNLNSLGNLSVHPFSTEVQGDLDWDTNGYNSNNVAWVNGGWAAFNDYWKNFGTQTAWEANGGEFSANAPNGTDQYSFYAMSYTFTGEGTLSFSYDINSYAYNRTTYPTYAYAEGLVFIADDVVAFMEDGTAKGSYTYNFKDDGEHTVTWIFNYYYTSYNRYAKISNVSLKTSSEPEGFDEVARVEKTDDTTVHCNTLQGAIDVVEDGDDVALLKDVTENIDSTKGKSYILDMNDHTIDGGGEAANASVYRIDGGATVTLKNGTLTNGYITSTSASEATRGGGLYIGDAKDNYVTLKNMTITNNHARDGGGIYSYYCYLTIEDSEISYNSASTTAGGLKTMLMKYTDTFKNVDFIGNSVDGNSGSAIESNCTITLEDCEFRENVTNNTGSNASVINGSGNGTFTNCKFIGNDGGKHTVRAEGTYEFDGCVISDNTALETGGIMMEGSEKVTLKNTIIKDNEATSNEKDSSRDVYPSGGVLVASGTLKFESGAIYNNISGGDANDLYIRGFSSSTLNMIAPSEMKDGEKNFDDYVWRQPDGQFLSEELIGTQETSLSLTAFDNVIRPIAEYEGEKYNSLKEAVEKANEDSARENPAVVKLIAGEDDEEDAEYDGKVFSSEAVEIKVPMEIDLNGRTVFSNKAFIKDGVLFNVTGDGSLKFSGEGTVSGGIKLENNKPLELNNDFSTSGTISIVFNDENAKKFNDFNSDTSDIEVQIIKCSGADDKLESLDIDLTNITNPHVIIRAKDDNSIVAVNPVIKGVFVSNSGNDGANGTYSAPVKTIGQAISKLSEDEDTIYLLNTITVSSNETWSSGDRDTVTITRFSTKPNQSGTKMVNLTGGTLTLENITIDGGSEFYTNCGSIIDKGSSATLNINDGATLQNNDVSNTSSNESSRSGGAVYSTGGSINMTGGTIQNCTALLGGGIYCYGSNAKFDMSGGTITENSAEGSYRKYYGSGGGVTMTSGAQMTMSGGTISNNDASYGGGISLGTGETSVTVSPKEDIYQFKMTGGTLSGNSAGNGGGLFVQCTYKAEITGGNFTENTAMGGNFGGGALYVNGGRTDDYGNKIPDGEAYIRNVLIKDNHADVSGGAIAGCNTSNTKINITDGSVIYNNTSYESYQGTVVSTRADDILVSTSPYTDSFGSSKSGGEDHISKFMLDGTPYQWKHVGSGRYATEDDLNDNGGKHFYTDATPGIDDDDAQIKVRMTENESHTRGGAIGSNGIVVIGGEYEEPDEFSVKKVWENVGDNLERPNILEQLNIWVLGFKGSESAPSYITYNSLADYNDNWRDVVSFEDLSNDYEYVVLEEVILTDGRHIWSANGKDYEETIKGIMAVNYPDTEFIYSDDAKSLFSSELTDTTSRDNNEFSFTNTLTSTPTTYAPQITKTITGDIPEESQQFKFEIEADDDNPEGAELPTDTTATINGAGNTNFGDITFTKAGTYKFEIKETIEEVAGYTYDRSVWTLTVEVEDENYELKATATYTKVGALPNENSAEFTNIYKLTTTTYTPKITKTVTGNPPRAETFTFNIEADKDNQDGAELPDETTATVKGTGDARFGDITFKKAGTYKFKITESNGEAPGYTYDTSVWTLTVVIVNDNSELKVESHSYAKAGGTESEDGATFNNVYRVSSTEYAPNVVKEITGVTPTRDKSFTFSITAKENNPSGATMPNEKTVTVEGTGNASFDAITFTKAGTYSYEIRETKGDDAGYTYDTSVWTLTVVVKDVDSVLTVTSHTYTKTGASNNDAATFTNSYSVKSTQYEPRVKKTVTGNPTFDKTFSFSITAKEDNPSGATAPANSEAKVVGSGIASFGSIMFSRAGIYSYEIKETQGNEAGYSYDGSVWTLTIVVTDDNSQLKVESATYSKQGKENTTQAEFENKYSVTEVSYAPQVVKEITGDKTQSDKTFTFSIEASGNNPDGAKMPSNTTATVEGAGSTSFGNITFTKAGTYTYKIRETKEDATGYTYDESVWTLKVVIQEVDAVLKVASHTYTKSGTSSNDGATFTNTYTSTPTTYTPKVKKTVTGNAPSDETFEFSIKADKDNPDGAELSKDTATVKGAGSTDFGDITFTKAGTYTFEISETKGDAKGYTYDESVWTLTVVVVDKDSQLTIDSATYTKPDGTSSNERAEFENIYSYTATGSLTIVKTVTGNAGDKDKEFTFTVTLTDENGNPLEGEYSYTGSKEGTIKSGETIKLKHGESVTISGLPVGTQYTVTEVEANEDGYTTTAKGDSGTISEDGEKAEFTNEKNSKEEPTEPTNPTNSETPTQPTTAITTKPIVQTTTKTTTISTSKTKKKTTTNNSVEKSSEKSTNIKTSTSKNNSDNTPNTGSEDNKNLPIAFLITFVLGINAVYFSFRRKLKGKKAE